MKRKLITGILSVAATACLSLGISACGDGGGNGGNSGKNPSSYPTENFEQLNLDLYSFGGHYYYVFKEHRNWQSAEDYCENLGGHLATVTSQEEQDFVEDIVKIANVPCWLGAYRSGQNFVWVFGENFEYTNWRSGQPSGGDEYYLGIYANNTDTSYSQTGKWNDFVYDSGTLQGFVCEWENESAVGDRFNYYNKLSSVEDLKKLNNSSDKYVLTADVDLSNEANWTPISGFSGILCGNGRTVTNLTINSVNEKNIGLFSELNGTVQDLNFENADITAKGDAGNAGIVAGTNRGAIKNITVSGSVNPAYYSNIGGIAGINDCGEITNCTNRASVKGANNIGGIVGSCTVNANGRIDGNINEGVISGNDNAGGIAGYLSCPQQKSNTTYAVKNLKNNNTVTGANSIGGIFGYVYGMDYYASYTQYYGYFEMSELFNCGEISGSESGFQTGGIIGCATRLNSLTVCENTADITGGTCVGGIVGYAPGTTIHASGTENNNTITGKGKVGGFAGQVDWVENAVNNGKIISTGVYVENGNSTAYVGGIAGYCTGLFGCTNNADIIVTTGGQYVGGIAGFVCLWSGNVKDNINNGSVSGNVTVGGIAGYLTCGQKKENPTYAVTNNENNGTVNGYTQVGGIFGQVYGMDYYASYTHYYGYFEMSLLKNTADITGSESGYDTGGLIGLATRVTFIAACENTGDITGGTSVGGFVGYAPNTAIRASGFVNYNTIIGKGKVGGFAGQAGNIENAVNSGEIKCTGTFMENDVARAYVGGIAGYCTGAVNCTNNSDVTVQAGNGYVGGIAGYICLGGTVSGCINNGAIRGNDYVGGIAGYLTCAQQKSNPTYTVKDNENKNSVTGLSSVGGIFGMVYGMDYYVSYTQYYGYFEVVYCTNEGEVTGENNVGGIVGSYVRLKTDNNLMDTNTNLYGNKLGH